MRNASSSLATESWANRSAHEPDETPLSQLLMDALAAGESRVQLAALMSADGDARLKLERLLDRIPASQSAA